MSPLTARCWKFDETGGPEVLHLASESLEEPGPGQALVRLRTIGLNRSDLMHLAGRYFGTPPRGSCLGQEGVGEIVALGPPGGARPIVDLPLVPGTRVGFLVGRLDFVRTGTYRDYGVYPVAALLPVPDRLDDAAAAGLWIAALTAAGALRATGIDLERGSKRSVLITAASSGVGLVALQLARAAGCPTIAVTTHGNKAAALAPLADHVVVSPSPAGLPDAVRQVSGLEHVDVSIDPVGPANVAALTDLAATDGHVLYYGLLGYQEIPFDMRSLILKDMAIHGYTVHRLLREPGAAEAVVHQVMQLAESGAVAPAVAATHPFTEAQNALREMAENAHVGKLVLEVNS